MVIVAVFPRYGVSGKVYLFGQQEMVIYHREKEFVKVGLEFAAISVNPYHLYGLFFEKDVDKLTLKG